MEIIKHLRGVLLEMHHFSLKQKGHVSTYQGRQSKNALDGAEAVLQYCRRQSRGGYFQVLPQRIHEEKN